MSRAVRWIAIRTSAFLLSALAAIAAGAAIMPGGAAAEPLPIFNPFVAFRAPTAGVPADAGKSSNWFGYQQTVQDAGNRPFRSVAGDWTVPSARQHTAGQAEASSDWVGVGGGCTDPSCSATDNTLIQAGTEQDIRQTGAAAYSAWFELVPIPAQPIEGMQVRPGDHMHTAISQVGSSAGTWTITIQNVTEGETFSATVPYQSGRGTAEWIEETPLRIGADAGYAPLPDLTDPEFTDTSVNGAPAHLAASQRTYLATLRGQVVGAPSVPTPGARGFAACAWSSTCG